MNEHLYPAMREIGRKADAFLDEHRRLMPKFGTIPLGSAWMSGFFRGEALLEMLKLLRVGATIESSAEAAKEHARLCIKKWNDNPRAASINGKHELAYWEGHCDADILWAQQLLTRPMS